jgi:hypothetical protein
MLVTPAMRAMGTQKNRLDMIPDGISSGGAVATQFALMQRMFGRPASGGITATGLQGMRFAANL